MKPDLAFLDIANPEVRQRVMAMIEEDLGPVHLAIDEMLDDPDADQLIDIVRFNPHAGEHPLSKMPLHIARDLRVGAGFAYPVFRRTREIIPETFAYLLSLEAKGDRAISGRWCVETNRNYAYLLRPVCEALAIDGKPFEYLDHDTLDLVVSAMLLGVNRRGQPLSGETIEQTIRAACRCIEYTNKAGMTSISVDGDALLARAYRVNSVYGADGKRLDRDRLLGARRHMIRPLTEDAVRRIEAALPVRPCDWEEGGPSSRPRATFNTGRRNGLRVTENLGIHIEDVLSATIVEREREYEFICKRTKGADHRALTVTGNDILEWQAYAVRERRHLIRLARDLKGANWDEPVELFVNGAGAGMHVGEATQPNSIQRDFRQVQLRLGMKEDVSFTTSDGRTHVFELMDHCYHDLRHTYAHDMYRLAQTKGDQEDWLGFVARRLGHSHVTTTSRIYLWPDRRKVARVGDTARESARRLIDA
jgi:integrase